MEKVVALNFLNETWHGGIVTAWNLRKRTVISSDNALLLIKSAVDWYTGPFINSSRRIQLQQHLPLPTSVVLKLKGKNRYLNGQKAPVILLSAEQPTSVTLTSVKEEIWKDKQQGCCCLPYDRVLLMKLSFLRAQTQPSIAVTLSLPFSCLSHTSRQLRLMSAADNLGNLFVALLAGIPLLIFLLFVCCACLEASITAARRSYKPHLPTRVRFADEAEDEEESRKTRNPLLNAIAASRSSSSNRNGCLEGSGLVAHSSYIQKFPNYRYSTIAQSGRATPPPVLKNSSRLDHEGRGSGSLRSPVSPLSDTQRLLDRDYCQQRSTKTPIASPVYSPQPGIAMRQDLSSSSLPQEDPPALTTPSESSQKSSPTYASNAIDCCGQHVDVRQQRRYSTPSSPTMYAYQQGEWLPGPSNYSSMGYLPEVRTYLHFMEDDYSNRQRSHSFSGRPAHKLQRRGVLAYTMPPARSPSLLEHTLADVIDLTESASKMSTPSSFGTTFLTPPGSTDHGSFKSPESGTPEWLLNADVPPHCYVTTAMESEEGGVAYKPQPHSVSRSSSFRTPII